MFGNFIYFIVALLIYATFQPPETPYFSAVETLFLFLFSTALFAGYARLVFVRIQRRLQRNGMAGLGQRFESALARLSILAVVLFAWDVYGLGLSAFFDRLPPFSTIPTLLALLFLALFIAYMALVWSTAHPVYRSLFAGGASRREYILSNISFSVPVLLPWLILSLISDVIFALPYETPRNLLSTTWGEAVYFLIFLLVVAIFGPAMIQKFWRCTPLEAGFFRSRIARLCHRAGVQYANILYWPIFGGRMITAGVMGMVRRFRYILVTNALLQFLGPEEVDAVIAHEIGHVKKKHLLFYLFFFAGYMLVSYATFDLVVYTVLFIEPVYRASGNLGIAQTTVSSVLLGLMFIVLFLVYFRFIFGYFMRNFERQADTYVFSLFDSARPLMTTLQKIALTSGHADDKPNWHHYSIRERIEFLQRCESDRRWIGRHERKIRNSIAVYLVGIAVVAGIGYQLGYGEPGRRLSAHFFERVITARLDENPQDPQLHQLLGDLYYNRKDYRGAINAYESALALDAGQAEALNNLAWLYATCEEQQLREPARALILAERAAELEPVAHVLDTLAEAYFVNGMVDKAAATARRALELAVDNRKYFSEQLERFTRARNTPESETPGVR